MFKFNLFFAELVQTGRVSISLPGLSLTPGSKGQNQGVEQLPVLGHFPYAAAPASPYRIIYPPARRGNWTQLLSQQDCERLGNLSQHDKDWDPSSDLSDAEVSRLLPKTLCMKWG